MSDPVIVVFPRGQLDSKSKERLTKTGIIWLEADEPERISVLRPAFVLSQSSIDGDGIIRAAISAMAEHLDMLTCRRFVANLSNAMKQESKP